MLIDQLKAIKRRYGQARAPDGSLASDNFIKWFGQSKVVDDQGAPKVMYHGTPVFDNGMGDLHEFDRMWTVHNLRGRESSIDNIGTWFSSIPDDNGAGKYSGTQGVIYPVYLAISNPHVTTFDRLVRLMHNANGNYELAMAKTSPSKGDVHNLRVWLRNAGYDGIQIQHDTSRANISTEFEMQDAWIPLQATQIKSAIGNSGLFQSDSSLITDGLLLKHSVEKCRMYI